MVDYKPHVVRQGEHVAKLAFVRGADAEEVWNHPSNDNLRAKRSSMDVLYPGDVIHLPEGATTPLPLEKGSNNRYTARIPRRKLTLALASTRGPYANEPYEIRGLPGPPDAIARKGTTGPNGEVDVVVPVTVRELGVFLPNPNLTYLVRVGDADPIAEASGVQKRLENLGFLERGVEHDPEEMQAGVRAFQAKTGLPVTGKVDKPTLDKLAEQSGQPD
ncbi:MAG: peptidoglycan-binding protein [Polyangiaceae bacterium]|nr:peptidoglycan-binding protein [Polyangiaceae bacterium]